MKWYYSTEGKARGPASEEQLSDLARDGAVSTDTLIWHPGLEDWEPVWKLRPEIMDGQLNKSAMARQAKGTTDRIPLPTADPEPAPAAATPEKENNTGVFSRLLSRLMKK